RAAETAHFVLQREVEMAGGGPADAADLAAHPDIRQDVILAQEGGDVARDLADGERRLGAAAEYRRREGETAHSLALELLSEAFAPVVSFFSSLFLPVPSLSGFASPRPFPRA